MSIADNLKQVLAELPQGVRLVAVSKFHPNEAIEEAYQAGDVECRRMERADSCTHLRINGDGQQHRLH